MTELEHIVDQMHRSLVGVAWHGPAVLETLRGVTAEAARARPIARGHTIWELALHVRRTADVVLGRMNGTIGALEDDEYWLAPGEQNEGTWRATLADLEDRHHALIKAVIAFDPTRLDAPLYSGGGTAIEHFLGYAQHNTYHAGQIALLKRLLADTSTA